MAFRLWKWQSGKTCSVQASQPPFHRNAVSCSPFCKLSAARADPEAASQYRTNGADWSEGSGTACSCPAHDASRSMTPFPDEKTPPGRWPACPFVVFAHIHPREAFTGNPEKFRAAFPRERSSPSPEFRVTDDAKNSRRSNVSWKTLPEPQRHETNRAAWRETQLLR